MVQRHLRIRSVQGSDMDVIETPFAAQEHLVQRPIRSDQGGLRFYRNAGERDRAVTTLGCQI
jgi:hypothetical protein